MRLKKPTWWMVIVGVVVVVLAVMAFLPASPGYSTGFQRLPDGSRLRVAGTFYGHTQTYTQPRLKKWQRSLAARLPSFVTDRLGWWGGGESVGGSARPGESNLVVITICEQARSRSLWDSPQMAVYDEQGRQSGVSWPDAISEGRDATHQRQVASWTVEDFPKTARHLVLRFSVLAAEGKTRRMVGEFVVSNPALTNAVHN